MSEDATPRADREPEATSSGVEGARGVSRRRVLQVMAASAAAAAALPAACGPGGEGRDGATGSPEPETPGRPAGNPLARGTPTDPDLLAPVIDWEFVLEEHELETLAALCDAIIPEDDHSPSASTVGAHDFINEWVSAPYDGNRNDLTQIRGGLIWLDRESRSRFGASFARLNDDQKAAICDDICYEPDAAPEFRVAARFFDRARDLTSTAFWTTEEGMADLGFVGNVPRASFDGPPREVLERLGLS